MKTTIIVPAAASLLGLFLLGCLGSSESPGPKAPSPAAAKTSAAAPSATSAGKTPTGPAAVTPVRSANQVWKAIHLTPGGAAGLRTLEEQIPALAKLGVNTLVVEIDYGYDYKSHPELRGGITKAAARQFAAACRKENIRAVPMINCLGHQSWAANTAALLRTHPDFDETPGQYPDNKGIYCRSWCPQNPDVNKVIFDLMDELIDGFEADTFHVGMDEVFIVGSEFCPRCKGMNPAKLFAKAVTDLYDHLKSKNVTTMMWADRLIDGNTTGLGEWEAAKNGTAPAIDLIPKDIILVPWHYTKRAAYVSIPLFIKKGFRVIPAGWNKVDAVEALIDYSRAQKSPLLIGYMATTWSSANTRNLPAFEPMVKGMEKIADWKTIAP